MVQVWGHEALPATAVGVPQYQRKNLPVPRIISRRIANKYFRSNSEFPMIPGLLNRQRSHVSLRPTISIVSCNMERLGSSMVFGHLEERNSRERDHHLCI